jgi:predicted metal-dependent hydrolase
MSPALPRVTAVTERAEISPPRGTRGTPKSEAADRRASPAGPVRGVPEVVVRRSARRRRSAVAFQEAGKTVVVVPAGLTAAQEAHWVRELLARVEARERRLVSDGALAQRAEALSQRYLEGRARPSSVRWVTNQNRRWGSCTPADRSIRLSHHLQAMPDWVVDSVLLHELAHLLEPGHGPRFQALVRSYPHVERARGFLAGVTYAWGRPPAAEVCEPDGGQGEVPGPAVPVSP